MVTSGNESNHSEARRIASKLTQWQELFLNHGEEWIEDCVERNAQLIHDYRLPLTRLTEDLVAASATINALKPHSKTRRRLHKKQRNCMKEVQYLKDEIVRRRDMTAPTNRYTSDTQTSPVLLEH